MADPPELRPIASKPAEVLAHTSNMKQPWQGAKTGSTVTPLAHEDLAKLIKSHPRGKLFNLAPEAALQCAQAEEDYGFKERSSTPIKTLPGSPPSDVSATVGCIIISILDLLRI